MGIHNRWPPSLTSRDTARRAERICAQAGIAEQRTLAGEQATADAVLEALRDAGAVLADGGVLVLTFSGHTERGNGPIGTARWCLVQGGLELSRIAHHLALLPRSASVVVISDTCYAAAIIRALVGTQAVIVVAGCGEEETMVIRARSEFVVRLEDFVCSTRASGSLEQLRELLEADTPDCERPVVWTNAAHRWSAPALAVPRRTEDDASSAADVA